MGASTGALLSGSARSLGLAMSNGTGAFAVVGAAAMMAATSHAPFTAVVLVYELTERYVVLLPAAIACVMATLVATLLRREPAYDAELRRRGISRSSPRAAAVVMRDRRVAPLVRSIRQTVPDTTPAQEVLSRRKYLRQSVLVVVDSITGTPLGILDLDRIEGVDPDAVGGPSVGDLMSRCPSARHDRTLTEAVAQFVRYKVPALPVVDDAGRACGLLWRHEVLDACARELATEFALPARDPMSASDTPLVHSDGVAAVLVPAKLVGRSVRSVDLRKLYGLVCLGIRRATDDGTFAPVAMAPTVVFTVNDLLIVSGPSDRITQMHEPSPSETTPTGRGD
jgi:CBS domain-containing protein